MLKKLNGKIINQALNLMTVRNIPSIPQNQIKVPFFQTNRFTIKSQRSFLQRTKSAFSLLGTAKIDILNQESSQGRHRINKSKIK